MRLPSTGGGGSGCGGFHPQAPSSVPESDGRVGGDGGVAQAVKSWGPKHVSMDADWAEIRDPISFECSASVRGLCETQIKREQLSMSARSHGPIWPARDLDSASKQLLQIATKQFL